MGTSLELAPAAGSAEPAGHPVEHRPSQSPTAPDISRQPWNGENSTSDWLPGILPYLMGLPFFVHVGPRDTYTHAAHLLGYDFVPASSNCHPNEARTWHQIEPPHPTYTVKPPVWGTLGSTSQSLPKLLPFSSSEVQPLQHKLHI